MHKARRSLLACLGFIVVVAAVSCSGSIEELIGSNSGGGGGGIGEPGITTAGVAPPMAQVAVAVHDAAGPSVAQAWVTFAGVEVHAVSGRWIPLTGSFPATVDLLTLVGGREFTLGAGLVPEGRYDRLRIACGPSRLVLADGRVMSVPLPTGGTWKEHSVSLDAKEGSPATVVLDYRVETSFRLTGERAVLEPDIVTDRIVAR